MKAAWGPAVQEQLRRATDYVSKPFDLKNVARLIDYALLPPSA